LDSQKWTLLKITLSLFVEHLNILLQKFFINRVMESQLIGGVSAHWFMKWLLVFHHFILNPEPNYLTKSNLVIPTFPIIWARI